MDICNRYYNKPVACTNEELPKVRKIDLETKAPQLHRKSSLHITCHQQIKEVHFIVVSFKHSLPFHTISFPHDNAKETKKRIGDI